jgi:hypothetical protein
MLADKVNTPRRYRDYLWLMAISIEERGPYSLKWHCNQVNTRKSENLAYPMSASGEIEPR